MLEVEKSNDIKMMIGYILLRKTKDIRYIIGECKKGKRVSRTEKYSKI